MIYEVTLRQTNEYLHERIRTANIVKPFYVEILKKIQKDRLFQQQKEYKVDETRLLWSMERLYIPEGGDIRTSILTKFHWTPYSGNSTYQNMISAVKRQFFRHKLKVGIALFIAKCQEC